MSSNTNNNRAWFGLDTPVLDFRANSGHIKRSDERGHSFLLWPAFMRQMLVRRSVGGEFNLFQRHIFQLCCAGVRDRVKLLNYLLPADHPDQTQIVDRILAELIAKQALTPELKPVEGAAARFESGRNDSLSGAIFCFQDPWTSEVWPRFIDDPRVHTAEVQSVAGSNEEGRQGRFARLQVGTAGKPRNLRAFVVEPGDVKLPEEPGKEEIMRKHHAWREEAGGKLRGERPGSFRARGRGVMAVTKMLEAKPVFLLTYVFSLVELQDLEPWEAADPFGLGVSRPFQRRIKQIIRQDERLRAYLERQFTVTDDMPVTLQAEDRVCKRLLDTIRDQQELFDELVDLEVAAMELERPGNDRKARWRAIKAAHIQAQVTVERVFDLLRGRHPIGNPFRAAMLLENRDAANAERLNFMAKKLGFEMGENGRLPDSLARVKIGKIRNAATTGEESINGRMLAALVAAAIQGETNGTSRHPLWNAAQLYPRLLLDIDRLGRLRNQVAHAAQESSSLNAPSVADVVNIAHRATLALLYPEEAQSRWKPLLELSNTKPGKGIA